MGLFDRIRRRGRSRADIDDDLDSAFDNVIAGDRGNDLHVKKHFNIGFVSYTS